MTPKFGCVYMCALYPSDVLLFTRTQTAPCICTEYLWRYTKENIFHDHSRAKIG